MLPRAACRARSATAPAWASRPRPSRDRHLRRAVVVDSFYWGPGSANLDAGRSLAVYALGSDLLDCSIQHTQEVAPESRGRSGQDGTEVTFQISREALSSRSHGVGDLDEKKFSNQRRSV